MIYSVSGRISAKEDNFVVLETCGLGFQIMASDKTIRALPEIGNEAKLFCHFHLREDGAGLFGFKAQEELEFFELLISVAGVGPKSALSVLEIADLKELSAAIKENRPDLLTRASGIGRKTAERIILELKNKVEEKESEAVVKKMEGDADIVETLVGLGYRRDGAKAALSGLDPKISGIEARLKATLKALTKK
jgi:Holliday junction DNA helicase RuvA